MGQYCGTEQRVLKAMRTFLDERDYKGQEGAWSRFVGKCNLQWHPGIWSV